MNISSKRFERIVRDFRGRRVAVLGDLMLDRFLFGGATRLSPEAPVPVVEIDQHSTKTHPGGAGNVAANISALGGQPLCLGVVGRDEAGREIVKGLRALGVETRGIVAVEGRPTTVKLRVMAQHQQIVRADWETREVVPRKIEARLLRSLRKELSRLEVVVLSDYGKGLLTPSLLGGLLALCQERRVPVFLDPKPRPAYSGAMFCRGVTAVTPNLQEAGQLAGVAIDDEKTLELAGSKLLAFFNSRFVLVTRGKDGMTLFEATRDNRRPSGSVHIPSLERQVFDRTGAGDTVISTLALSSAAGASMREAAVLANHAAGIVVGKLGTATLTPRELLQSLHADRG